MYSNVVLPENKKGVKMGIAKITAILAGVFNIFIYVFAWVANLDNTKSTILFIAALGMSLYRFYRWAINSWQNKKLKDLSIYEKELELRERQLEIDERRDEQVLNELSLHITGLSNEQRRNQNKK